MGTETLKLSISNLTICFSDPAYQEEIKVRREFFNKQALRWEEEHNQQGESEKLAEVVSLFDLQPNQLVLDAGCGSGCLIPYILKKIEPRGKLLAVDLSEKMLALARQKWSSPHVFFLQADVCHLGLKELIDRLICFRLLPHLPDKKKALLSFRSYLKKDGQLFIVHLANREQVNKFHARLPAPLCEDKLPEREEMINLFHQAGLRIEAFWENESLYFIKATLNDQ